MSIMSFKNMFFKEPADDVKFNGLGKGEYFPKYLKGDQLEDLEKAQRNYEKTIVGFVSLSCLDCIDFLEDLYSYSNIIKCNIWIFHNGDANDTINLKQHYAKYDYIKEISNELLELFKIPKTPYVYFLDSDLKVMKSSMVKDITKFKELI
ncbi:hypothetical protein [Paenibacillus alkalitolerans]|uniref:hypothetical protein n=1 Tax=Paenibacillus alkalitolerans TaxID=2799335 RepID=UPI0018F2BABC|nr:hypothetical protein [Paenibacillus alkalitolerans]